MSYQIKLELSPDESNRLLDLAILELRSLPNQARILIRQALTTTSTQEEAQNAQKSEKTDTETP